MMLLQASVCAHRADLEQCFAGASVTGVTLNSQVTAQGPMTRRARFFARHRRAS